MRVVQEQEARLIVGLKLEDVLCAQRKLEENNVSPPYELRAPESMLRGLLATLEGGRVVEHPKDDQPGEKWLGRICHTHLIAVPEPTCLRGAR